MKKTIISLVVISALPMSAHALTIKQANENITIAEHDYSEALANYKSAALTLGSAVVNSGAEKMLASAGAARAQAYADKNASLAQAQSAQDAADKAQAIQDRNNRINNPGMSHRPNTGTQTTNAVSHVTASQRPSASYDTMTPGITKESNPAGHPTHQIAPATRLDSSTADRQAGKAAAKAAKAQHKTELSNYGTKQSGTATYSEPTHSISYSGTSTRPNTGATNTMQSGVKNDPTGNPTNQQSPEMGKSLTHANDLRSRQQAVALADARQAETDRQAKEQAKNIAKNGVKNDPTGNPTNQQSPEMGASLTHANDLRSRQQAVALADARQAEADRQAKEQAKEQATNIANYGVKNDPTGNPTNQQSPEMGNNLTQASIARNGRQAKALADARQAEVGRQNKTLGKANHQTNEMHEQPLHQSATATPAVNRATRLDSSAADQSAAAQAQADAQAQHAKDIANYGVKRSGTATYNEQPHTVTYSGATMHPNTGATINVAANSLKPDTRVQVTDQTGHKSVVKASTLTPSTQVSVPFHSAFQHVGKGGNSHEKSTSHVDHGTGTGADNAHDHAFGGHDGAGGGFHM